MSLTLTILLIYGACLVGTIASPPAPGNRDSDGAGPRRLLGALLVPALALLAASAPAGPARAADAIRTVSGAATVIDGATLAIGGQRLRLHGIDAPDLDQTCFDARERGYACGRVAAEALAARIAGGTVACEARATMADGTATALCRLGADDLAAWMVGNGYAVADRGSATYLAEDQRAWGRRLGLWAGVFELPGDRRRLRGATAGL
ncbi:thermonuclease family protein [Methylorubrum zatmanii]|uniref:Thermonuclease family protein n=1 Tax=Methylorubrum zatmanii TaxID=29429 RepID=A0ABW1WV43_9HYPH|nr:thermonuclease family protein [Methylorubrum zatmanii]MBD8907213.1 nuclease [Methylorubrum zatmanii]